jgi:hypothetical protein
MTFMTSNRTDLISGTPITSFLGQKNSKDVNVLSMPIGQLIYNQNLEYISSGTSIYLRTKRGSTLIKDIIYKAYGAGDYRYNLDDSYLVWVDDNKELRYYDESSSTINTLTTGIDNSNNIFVPFGLGTNSALYGCNNIDGVYKISGSTPSFSLISNSPPLDFMAFSSIAGRMFGVKGTFIYFTEIQQLSAVTSTNLETWNITTNTAQPSPDSGAGFNCVVDSGDAMFFFKDTGIWILPNPQEDTIHWFYPRANADIGSKSPLTCKWTRYGDSEGIIYLASDKTLRFCTAQIERNAGPKPTIVGGSSKIISKYFQTTLNEIPTAYLNKCTAEYFGRYYILNIVGVGEDTLTKTIIIDTEKLLQESNLDYPQPYFFFATNMNNTCHVVRKSNNELYGFNKQGYISKLLVEDVYSEAVPTRINSTGSLAIPWVAYTGWMKANSSEVELAHGYLYWSVSGRWNIEFGINSFVLGEGVPEYDECTWTTLSPQHVGGSYFDIDIFDVARFSADNIKLSQNINSVGKGNYFLYGFRGTTKNQWASIFGVEQLFKQVRISPLGKR